MNTDRLKNYIQTDIPMLYGRDGWCTRQKAEALGKAVLETRPSVIVEIGVYGGMSLIALALAGQQKMWLYDEPATVIGIDPWTPEASTSGFEHGDDNRKWWGNLDHNAVLSRCQAHLNNYEVTDIVTLVRLTSEQFYRLVTMAGREPFIGLLHIDGNHSEIHSIADVTTYVPLVVPGGVVVFDDTNWESTKRAQELLAGFCDFEYFVESEGEQCGFYRRKHDFSLLTTDRSVVSLPTRSGNS